jgi:adenine-specific DNA-methyltransferase
MTMQPIFAGSPESQSADLKVLNLAKLKELFPELLTERIVNGKMEAALNVDVLKQLVGDATVTDAEEKYGLHWHGKRRARQLALTPSTGTLLPAPGESIDWETTQNLMIEGDNLEVLKLLQKSYAGKVKLIYIDPPYNTGKDFVYPDNFQDNIKNYLELTGQIGESGNKLSSNTEASGRFHTDWLNMMYPRLKLAWNLLRKDGFIIISIDDHELNHLRTQMDEICGEENFIGTMVIDKNRKNDAKLLSIGHEYMIVYAKEKAYLKEIELVLRAPKEGVEEIKELFESLRKQHNDNWELVSDGLRLFFNELDEDDPRKPLARFNKVDSKGLYRTDGDASWPGGGGPTYPVPHPMTGKPCKIPSRGWVWPTYERMKEEIEAGSVVFGIDETTIPSIRRDLFIKNTQVMRSVQFSYAQKASQDFQAIFEGENVFQNPKSFLDIRNLVAYYTSPGDLVVDFFGGSGTTGHGVMIANAEAQSCSQRRFILVQIPEKLDPEDRDQKNAVNLCDRINKPRTIAEITKERLRRAGAKVKAENPMFAGDTGFRVFKLDTSNIRPWNPNRDDLEGSLFANLEHIQPGRTENDVLFEILLKLGLDLCVPIETRSIAGKSVHSVGGGVLLACLDEHIQVEDVEALALGMAKWRNELGTVGDSTAVFRDSAFENDVAKSNLAAILEQHGIKTVRSL